VTESGALLGYNAMDGKIPGCFKYGGWATFKVKAIVSDFSIDKTVRINGAADKTFKENVNAQPGDTVDFQIQFVNNGGEQLKDVVIKDTLPTGLTYIPGSTKLANSDGTRSVADGITSSGINIGGYMGGANAYMLFSAKVADNDGLPACGVNVLRNVAKATTAVGSEEDPATVTVNKDCPKPEFTCDRLNITKIARTDFRFTTNYTVKNTTFKNITYVISGNGVNDTKVSTDSTGLLNYSQTKPGTYQVVATLNTADGNSSTAACKGTIVVDPEPEAFTCNALHIAPIERTKFNFTTDYTIENVTFEKVTYVVGGNSYVVTNPDTKYVYNQNVVGTYNVQAYITVKTADGSSKTSNMCTGTLKVDPEEIKPEYICKALEVDRNRISKGGSVKFTVIPELKGKVSVSGIWMDFGDGTKTDPALTTDYVHQYNTAGTFKAKAYINFDVDGKVYNDVSSVECEKEITVKADEKEKCPIKGKGHLDIDDPECKNIPVNPPTPPYTPTELPQTGGELFGLLGLGALTTSAGYYINSRRKLRGM
jgi:uncharacterized repeat protein (TIGR01451 family)